MNGVGRNPHVGVYLMGCDIHGWIEANRYATKHDPDEKWAWESIVDLRKTLERSYTLFGRLSHTGSRQQAGDTALFADRGIPEMENLGDKAQEDYEYWEADAHHESHFTHAELTQTRVRVNVGEGATQGIKPIEYLRDGLEDYNADNPDARQVGEDLNNSMRYGRKKRRWECAFSISEALADTYGHEQVRWVIWFDN